VHTACHNSSPCSRRFAIATPPPRAQEGALPKLAANTTRSPAPVASFFVEAFINAKTGRPLLRARKTPPAQLQTITGMLCPRQQTTNPAAAAGFTRGLEKRRFKRCIYQHSRLGRQPPLQPPSTGGCTSNPSGDATPRLDNNLSLSQSSCHLALVLDPDRRRGWTLPPIGRWPALSPPFACEISPPRPLRCAPNRVPFGRLPLVDRPLRWAHGFTWTGSPILVGQPRFPIHERRPRIGETWANSCSEPFPRARTRWSWRPNCVDWPCKLRLLEGFPVNA